jgi:hypothetical protein
VSKLTENELEQLYLKWTALGAEKERERITKLLDKHSGDNHDAEECSHCWKFYGIGAALALIKGQQT